MKFNRSRGTVTFSALYRCLVVCLFHSLNRTCKMFELFFWRKKTSSRNHFHSWVQPKFGASRRESMVDNIFHGALNIRYCGEQWAYAPGVKINWYMCDKNGCVQANQPVVIISFPSFFPLPIVTTAAQFGFDIYMYIFVDHVHALSVIQHF